MADLALLYSGPSVVSCYRCIHVWPYVWLRCWTKVVPRGCTRRSSSAISSSLGVGAMVFTVGVWRWVAKTETLKNNHDQSRGWVWPFCFVVPPATTRGRCGTVGERGVAKKGPTMTKAEHKFGHGEWMKPAGVGVTCLCLWGIEDLGLSPVEPGEQGWPGWSSWARLAPRLVGLRRVRTGELWGLLHSDPLCWLQSHQAARPAGSRLEAPLVKDCFGYLVKRFCFVFLILLRRQFLTSLAFPFRIGWLGFTVSPPLQTTRGPRSDHKKALHFARVWVCLDAFASFGILRPWSSFCGRFCVLQALGPRSFFCGSFLILQAFEFLWMLLLAFWFRRPLVLILCKFLVLHALQSSKGVWIWFLKVDKRQVIFLILQSKSLVFLAKCKSFGSGFWIFLNEQYSTRAKGKSWPRWIFEGLLLCEIQ